MSIKPETYGPKCGGVDPQQDAIKCQHQHNQEQVAMTKGGGNEVPPGKQIAPRASGGVEVNSPQNNDSNSADLNSVTNQSTANAKYDNVTPGPVDNSSGPSGGSRKKRTRKHRKLSRKYRKSKRRKSQKSRRRKVFVGCNSKSRKRLGGKTKRQSGWGCMSGGKRRTKKCKRVRFRM